MEITKEQGIEIYKSAGYVVEVKDFGFYVYENDIRISYNSSNNYLNNLNSVIGDIKRLSFARGYKRGREKLQNEIKTLLSIQ